MTGVQLFLMVFGALLSLIGVLVFFLLAWFKETTGQEHHNAIKILQAEFRFSNPALVIFAGGLLLMVAPFFIGQAMPGSASPPDSQPNSPVASGPTPTLTPAEPQPVRQPPAVETASNVVAPVGETPTPTFTPTPTPTATPTTPPTDTPTPAVTVPDATGRWRNQNGFLDFRRLGREEYAYSDFDNFGNLVGQGTASQDEETLFVNGEGFIFTGFEYTYYTYTGEFIVSDNILAGDLYDSFGNYLGSVSFTRDPSGGR